MRRCANTAAAVAALLLAGVLCLPAQAPAAPAPQDMLIYMPYGLVHSIHSSGEVDEYLAQVDGYGIGQVVFAMPRFKAAGTLKVPKRNLEMLRLWAQRAAAYDEAHAADLSLTVVFNGTVKTNGKGLDLESAGTRANIVAAIEASLGTGLAGVQLDLEPYPVSPGFLTLLEGLDAMFARVGFHGRLSVTAPATVSRWTPSYLSDVSNLVGELDPLFYDSESTSASAYASWVRAGLDHYTADAAAGTRIVAVLPSYSANRWHSPLVENITTATAALSEALTAGSRVNGAGIWSGWGFLLDEEGAYDGSSDRADWLSATLALPFSP